jgi:tetratricopeptide (TPR) repeat protein
MQIITQFSSIFARFFRAGSRQSRHFILVVFLLLGVTGCLPAHQTADSDVGGAVYATQLWSPESSAMYHFARGRLLADDGEFQAAAAALEQAIEYDPRSAYLRTAQARFLLATGDEKRALKVAEEALQQNPDLLDVHLLLGGIYFRDRDYSAAARHFKRVVELDPEHENAYLHLAVAYGRLGEQEAAMDAVQQLLERKPDSLAGQLTLGRLLRDLQMPDEAEAVYRKLIVAQPGLISSYLELGVILEHTEHFAEAVELYRQGLKKNGRSLLLRRRLILLLVSLDKLDAALDELRVLAQLNPDDREIRRKIGLILLEKEEWADAETVFSELLVTESDAEQTLFYYATALEKQQKWQEALEVVSRIGPDSELFPDALYHQSYLQHRLGRNDKAIELMRERMTHDPQRVDFFDFLASLQELENDLPAARSTLEAGIDQFPDDAEIRYHLGLVFEKSGERANALATMEEVLLKDPEHAEALNYVAYSLAEQGVDLDRALSMVEKALEQKQAPHILDTLGWVQYRSGRFEPARVALEQAAAQMSSDPLIWQHLGDVYRALGLHEDAAQAYRHALEFDPDSLELQQRLKELEDRQ